MTESFSELRKKWTAEQEKCRKELILQDPSWLADRIAACDLLVGGLDISISRFQPDLAVATLAVVDLQSLKLVTQKSATVRLTIPYVPTYLGYREIDAYMQVYQELKDTEPQSMPDILMVDGNGTLHPRGFGSACLVGYQLSMPTFGVAKSLLGVGVSTPNKGSRRKDKLEEQKKFLKNLGDRMEIRNADGVVCGIAMLNCARSKRPIFVSPGHRISMDTSCLLAQKMSKFRMPEPTRLADKLSRKEAREIDSTLQPQ